MTHFEISVSKRIQFIAEELIKIGGNVEHCVLADYEDDFNETMRIVDNDDSYSLWGRVHKHEILVNHSNQTVEIALFDYGYATYEIDGRFLLLEFNLREFLDRSIDGKGLIVMIENAYLEGLSKYEKQLQLSLFDP